jgi:hypothetical protein
MQHICVKYDKKVTHKYPSPGIFEGQAHAVPNRPVSLWEGHTIKSHSLCSQLALFLCEEPFAASSLGLYVVRQKEEGDQGGKETARAVDDEEPLPACDVSGSIKT